MAGLASKTFARQAFCRVVKREGSEIGSSTLTFAMLDSISCPVLAFGPWLAARFTLSEAPLPLKLSLLSVEHPSKIVPVAQLPLGMATPRGKSGGVADFDLGAWGELDGLVGRRSLADFDPKEREEEESCSETMSRPGRKEHLASVGGRQLRRGRHERVRGSSLAPGGGSARR